MNDRPRRAASAAALIACLGLGGCVPMLGAAAAREVDRSMPEAFAGASAEDSAAERTVSEFFGDPLLEALVDEALANNQELAIVAQEIAIARAEITARRGELFPVVSVGADAGIEKVGRYTSQGASDEADEILPGRKVPEHLPKFGLGFVASWEIDVWSKLRDARDAAIQRFLGSIEGQRFAVTQVVAEIARSYYELVALDNQLAILRANIEVQERALAVGRAQQAAGQVTALAVQRFEAEVLNSQSLVFDIQQRIVEAENKINFLVGRFPQPVARNSEGFLDRDPIVVQAGLPGQLLANRPDLRRAELDLAAAKLDVAVARKRFYPSLGIDASVGLESFKLSKLGELPESLFFDAIGGITAPLLNRTAITAGYRAANAQQMQAVLAFEQAIRRAFAEAQTQLQNIANLGEKVALKSRQVEVLRTAIDTSSQLFGSARADYGEVLLTRRDALDSQMELIETRQRQWRAVVDMYQALGGGWRRPEDDEPAR